MTAGTTVRVLVVEDEAIAAQAHAAYVERVGGFAVAGIARSGVEALRILAQDPTVDLILLDIHLPDVHGLDLLQRIRQEGHLADVIAVTSARDLDVVKRAVAQGVGQYVLKPFTFAGLRAKLEQYLAYRQQLEGSSTEVVQDEVDELLRLRRPARPGSALPKGTSADTLQRVTDYLRAAEHPASASEVADATGTSRVTARRYLEHLASDGLAIRQSRYGGSGRPELEYRWRSTGSG